MQTNIKFDATILGLARMKIQVEELVNEGIASNIGGSREAWQSFFEREVRRYDDLSIMNIDKTITLVEFISLYCVAIWNNDVKRDVYNFAPAFLPSQSNAELRKYISKDSCDGILVEMNGKLPPLCIEQKTAFTNPKEKIEGDINDYLADWITDKLRKTHGDNLLWVFNVPPVSGNGERTLKIERIDELLRSKEGLNLQAGAICFYSLPHPNAMEVRCIPLSHSKFSESMIDMIKAVRFTNKGIPSLRFPEFAGEWPVKKLGDLCEMKAGKFVPAEEISPGKTVNHSYPCYGGNGLRGYLKDYSHDGDYSLIGRQGALCGNVNYVMRKFYATEHALVVYPKSNIDRKWLHYQLKRLNLNRLATGQAQPGLSVDTIRAIKQSSPQQKEEQRKIGSFLTVVDERIALVEKKAKLLKKYKKGVMQKIFTQQIRFKDEDGSPYPEWDNRKLEDLYVFRWTNSLSRDNLSDEVGEYKNIHYGDIHTKYQGRLDTTDSNVRIPYVKTGPKLIIDKYLPTSILEEKDIVMADASEDYKDVGKSLEIAKTEGRTVAGLHTIVMRPYEDFALGFGAYLFNSSQVHKQIARLATGVSVLGISKSNLSKILLPIPCVDEQRKITDFLVAVDDKIKLEEAKLEKAKEFKESLLQRMFV